MNIMTQFIISLVLALVACTLQKIGFAKRNNVLVIASAFIEIICILVFFSALKALINPN